MPVLDRATLRQLVALPPACLLLTSCMSDGGAAGAVATGHFSARHQFPVVMISWCGDSPPARIDLDSQEHGWQLHATRDFPGDEVEVDLSAPGEDWEITDSEGAPAYRVVPESAATEYTLGVTSADALEDEAEHDIATLSFNTELLAADDGVYVGTEDPGDGTLVSADEFPPEC
ncbi:hypothetical protein GCM10007079_22970 [Nocardiopsis terrae]|uniref:Uncharacterized protein n=1 Tax=Nocardiopsis terrae TaxID=372655 RepID=A0ABR9HGE7_9ACTN|nr:hypothetical protein [Nocardiopsis terrae]MBE1458095.1 hypothetical protein [Nocardiopsis terrae]GHC82225.1 hypothetical protein GCM10007079_22970 [Nocardiopsis terrae]